MKPMLIQGSEDDDSVGIYSLLLTEFATCEEVFNEFNHEGGGYDWESMIKYVLETKHRNLSKTVEFDSEASMFCAYSQDKESLEKVEEIINRLIDDHTELRQAISSVPEDKWWN